MPARVGVCPVVVGCVMKVRGVAWKFGARVRQTKSGSPTPLEREGSFVGSKVVCREVGTLVGGIVGFPVTRNVTVLDGNEVGVLVTG